MLFQESSHSTHSKHIIFVLACLTVRAKLIESFLAFRESFVRDKLFTNGASLMRFCSNTCKIVGATVLRLRNYFEILYSVIQRITVDMVNYFFRKWEQFSSEMFFHYKAMFHVLSAFPSSNTDEPVTRDDSSIPFVPRDSTACSPFSKCDSPSLTTFLFHNGELYNLVITK
jgi:hypothetical protein